MTLEVRQLFFRGQSFLMMKICSMGLQKVKSNKYKFTKLQGSTGTDEPLPPVGVEDIVPTIATRGAFLFVKDLYYPLRLISPVVTLLNIVHGNWK